MRKSPGLLWPALITALAVFVVGATALSAAAPKRHDQLPLHAGSSGPRVSAIQWLEAGHKPNIFTQIKGTFKHPPNGYFGARTKSATVAYKWRLGYPQKGECGATVNEASLPTAGQKLFDLMLGKQTRPACWVALAAVRLKAVNTGPTVIALKARAYEQRLLDANIYEIPDSSNRGPAISYPAKGFPALQSATGAYGLAWCVSTQQTVFKAIGYGTFANDTAGVYAAVDYYAALNSLSAKAKIGALVAFIDYDSHGRRIPGTGHMGFVMKVEATGFTYSAGNDANRFQEHTIPFGSRSYTFIYLPRVA